MARSPFGSRTGADYTLAIPLSNPSPNPSSRSKPPRIEPKKVKAERVKPEDEKKLKGERTVLGRAPHARPSPGE